MRRFIELFDVAGKIICVVYIWEADSESGTVVLVVCIAVQIKEFGVAPVEACVGQEKSFVVFGICFCIRYVVNETRVYTGGGEDWRNREAENCGFEVGGVLRAAEEELKSNVGIAVVVDVGVNFVVVPIRLIGLFVRAIGPLYGGFAELGPLYGLERD